MRDAVLSLGVHDKTILKEDLNRIWDFHIKFEEEMITYTIPDTEGHMVAIPFEEVFEKVQVDSILKDFRLLIDAAEKHTPYSRFKISPKGKGNLKGKGTLQRSTNATKALPSNFKDVSKMMLPRFLFGQPEGHCDVITRRHHFVEYITSKLILKIDERIKKVEGNSAQIKQAQQTPETTRIQAQLNATLKGLKARKEAFEKMDGYALVMGLCTHPGSGHSSDDLDNAADFLGDLIRKELLGITQNGLDAQKGTFDKLKFWKSSPKAKLEPADEAYIQDVKGMLHTGRIQDEKGMLYTSRSEYFRAEYFKHCQKNRLEQKKEGLEDIFIREAVKFAAGPNYKPDTLVDSLIFDGVSEDMKRELETDLKNIARVSRYAIGHAQEGEFAPKPYPDKATDEEKKQIDLDNFQQLGKDIESVRSRVNQDLTVDQIPADSATGIQRYMPGRKTAIAGAVAVGLYTGTLRHVVSYIWNHPLSSLGLYVQGNGALKAIRSLSPSRAEALVGLTAVGTAGALTYAGMLDPTPIVWSTYSYISNNPAVSYALLHAARGVPSVVSSLAYAGEGVNRKLSRRRIVGLIAGAGAIGVAAVYGDTSLIPTTLQSASEYAMGATGWVVQQAWNYALLLMFLESLNQADLKKMVEAEEKMSEGWQKNIAQSRRMLPTVVQDVVNGAHRWIPQPLKAPAEATYRLLSHVGKMSRITSFGHAISNLLLPSPQRATAL